MSSQPTAAASVDPSMEDILASIRRILSEDEAAANPSPASPVHPPTEVLALDASMMVESIAPEHEDLVPDAPFPTPERLDRHDPDATLIPMTSFPQSPRPPQPEPEVKPELATLKLDEGLVAPEAAAAAANSVHTLLRKLAEERSAPVYRNGPTLEDLVREEIRPMLKVWLDSHVPAIVERLVRAEIERVVNRAVP